MAHIVALLLALAVTAIALAPSAVAEQASDPTSAAAAQLDVGGNHSCALLAAGSVRCWGFGSDGQLGYGNADTIGDDETPASVGPVNLGPGPTATAISAGDAHTCALVNGGSVRCWGFGAQGRLGYASIANVGDDEAPGSVGPVDLGSGRKAKAIGAGGGHTCAVLDNGTVRCWGFGARGQLGYGNRNSIGDTETPGTVGPVKLGAPATAISAGLRHTCALLTGGSVRCWGFGGNGQLGYGDTNDVGDSATPDTVGPVQLGAPATAISAGQDHTCALLTGGSVRCWGYGGDGELGYADTNSVGDDETPDSVGPVQLGAPATAISAGQNHTCAVLVGGTVRCWGLGVRGRLGYANTDNVGDDEAPKSVGPVAVGPGRTVTAISAGGRHTCGRLDNGSVRCWGYGGNGRLGYCDPRDIGDDEAPSTVGPISLDSGDGGAACPTQPVGRSSSPAIGAEPKVAVSSVASSSALRARGLRRCLDAVAAQAQREKRLAGHGSRRHRAKARRRASRHARSGRRRCLHVFGRTPGRINGLRARVVGKTQIELSFNAAGTDANRPPPAMSYLIKQSLRPIRSARGFARAHGLCRKSCRFTASRVGARLTLTVTDLRPHTTYYYAVAARDNVSARRGPISGMIAQRTR